MGTKKDIGSAFKERLENYTLSPDHLVWTKLEAQLKEDKKKRRALLFWFFGGAALLLSLFFVIRAYIPSVTADAIKNNAVTIQPEANDDHTRLQESKTALKNSKKDTTHSAVISTVISQQNTTTTIHKTQVRTPIKGQSKSITQQNKIINNHSKTTYPVVTDGNKEGKKSAQKQTGETTERSKDSLLAEVEELKKPTSERKKDSLDSKPNKRWAVFPHASLDYYGGFKTNSNDQITPNYGLYLSYMASKKMTWRIGINTMDLQRKFQISDSVSRQQKVTYLEFPLEVKYKLMDHKVKTSVIGGLSYLFVQDAHLTTNAPNSTNTIANKNAFNAGTLSVNIGMGFETRLFKDVHFSIEPMFKYHIKPYSQSVDFNPFTISISGGIRYKF